MNKSKLFFTLIVLCLAGKVNAQLYVSSAGNVSVGSVIPALTGLMQWTNGSALFSSDGGAFGNGLSAAYIRGENNYSTLTTPDYTWWFDDQTGFFHPGYSQIGVTIGGQSPLTMWYDPNPSPFPSTAIGNQFAFTGWMDFNIDWNDGDWSGEPIIYPVQAGTLQLGNSTNYIGDAWIWHGEFQLFNYFSSDSSIKTNINYSMDSIMYKLKRLKPATFNYKSSFFDSIPSYVVRRYNGYCKQYGFIAQDVRNVFPELVSYDSNSRRCSIAYDAFIAMLVDGFQVHDSSINNEQQQIRTDSIKQSVINDTLQAKLKRDSVIITNQGQTITGIENYLSSVQSCLDSLCGTSGTGGGHAPIRHHLGSNNNGDSNQTGNATDVQDVTLSALADAPLLYQNIPNPFSAGTKINYYLPSGTMGATIVFYDTYGNQLKQVSLNQTGNGTLNITPDNLTNGIYSYSLIINGAVIDTKKMILTK